MTDQVICKLLEKALNLSYIEQRLVEIIGKNLDQGAVAQEIWDTWQDEIIAKAAEIAAEEILPF